MKESSYLAGHEELLPRMFDLPTLAGFKKEHLRHIMSLSKVRSYDPGEQIIRQGEFDCWVYILISGGAAVIRDGKEISLLQRTGDLFGEMGVITGEARSASVVASRPTTCLAIDGSIFERESKAEHMTFLALFYRLFAEVLSARLAETNQELTRVKEQLDALTGKAGSAAP